MDVEDKEKLDSSARRRDLMGRTRHEASIAGDSDVYLRPTYLPWHRASASTRRSSARRPSLILQRAETIGGTKHWWKFTLRDWDDDEPQSWWFASIAIPLLAATIGPLANVLSIAALVTYWRECVSTVADANDSATCYWDGDDNNITSDLLGIAYADPRWCYNLNAVSLALGFVGNIFLLFNFTRRIRYIVALPVTILMWFVASGILMGISIAMAIYVPPVAPYQIYSQGFWFAIMAAILYFFCSVLLMINMIGYFLGYYPQNFTLTDAQRTLILQTMMFFIWLAGGAGVITNLESRADSGADAIPLNFSYTNALYFCDVTILTIGFGDLYPTSDAARGFVIPYAIGGIVALGLMVTSLTRFAGEIGSDKIIYRHIERSRARTVGRTVTSSLEYEDRRNIDLSQRPEISAPMPIQSRTATIKIADDKENNTELPSQRTLRRAATLPILQRAATIPLQRAATILSGTRTPKLYLLREEKDRFQAMRRIQSETERFKKYYALGMSVISFGILWCCGAVVFWQAEKELQGTNYFEALYFCYVSLLTIGYGDLAPKSNPGRAFFVVWSLIAIPTITLLISHLGETLIENIKDATSAAADFTVLPKEGIWRTFIESHPYLESWLLRRKEERATRRRMEEGLPIGPEPEADVPPTIVQLAEEDLSHHQLAHKLARAVKQVAKDTRDAPHKQYSYEEWVEFTRLIRFTAKAGEDVAIDEEEGMIEWDWIGEDSPMMAKGSEADFLLERLCESMQRYIMRIASTVKMPSSPDSGTATLFAGRSQGERLSEDALGPHDEKHGNDPEDSASVTIRLHKRHATFEDND